MRDQGRPQAHRRIDQRSSNPLANHCRAHAGLHIVCLHIYKKWYMNDESSKLDVVPTCRVLDFYFIFGLLKPSMEVCQDRPEFLISKRQTETH